MKKLSYTRSRVDVRTVTMSALLIAIQIVLNKISIGDPAILKIGIGFLGTALIGYLTGPWLGGVILVLVDIIPIPYSVRRGLLSRIYLFRIYQWNHRRCISLSPESYLATGLLI